ncbi:MAG: periplasmic heavy metal sensor [Bryobacteraceae bacterium]
MRLLGILMFTAAMVMAQSAEPSLDELKARIAELRKKYTDANPQVRDVQQQIRALEEQIAARAVQKAAANAQNQARAAELEARQAKQRAEQAQLRGQQELIQSEQKLQQQLDALRAATRVQANSETWWRNESMATTIGLSEAQVKRMDEVFQQSRLKLIEQKATLDREEAILEPLIASEALDEARTTSQFDRVAQARAELEKTRGRLLLGIRKQMDGKQWRKLNQMSLNGSGVDRRE